MRSASPLCRYTITHRSQPASTQRWVDPASGALEETEPAASVTGVSANGSGIFLTYDATAEAVQPHLPRLIADSRPPREDVPFPDKPPYTAFVGNMSFDCGEDEVKDMFSAGGVEVSE